METVFSTQICCELTLLCFQKQSLILKRLIIYTWSFSPQPRIPYFFTNASVYLL